jgi:uncharacterized repeat protein (TIGR03803 family)
MRSTWAVTSVRAAVAALAVAAVAVLTVVATPSAQAQTFTSLYSFSGSPDGSVPFAGVIIDKSGTLYGTTEGGGTSSDGTVYKFSKGTETVLHSFAGSDGAAPFAEVVMDKSGTLYGTTLSGGSSSVGTVFALDSSGTLTTLYSFTGGADGSEPFSGLILDKKGNLYGTTEVGGSSGLGTVFKLNIKTKKETVLHSFTGQPDGSYPLYGNLLMDKLGNLYGTATEGGSSNVGAVWEVSAKGKETVLYSFAGGSDGEYAFEQSLATDGKHTLYGTTEDGGAHSEGVVFEVNIKTKKEKVLYSFGSASGDGEFPSSGLVRDKKGNLFGTTQNGGASGLGTVFELAGTTETILHSFSGSDGSNPFTSPLLDEKGTLYGTTYAGGAHSDGTIYSIKP